MPQGANSRALRNDSILRLTGAAAVFNNSASIYHYYSLPASAGFGLKHAMELSNCRGSSTGRSFARSRFREDAAFLSVIVFRVCNFIQSGQKGRSLAARTYAPGPSPGGGGQGVRGKSLFYLDTCRYRTASPLKGAENESLPPPDVTVPVPATAPVAGLNHS